MVKYIRVKIVEGANKGAHIDIPEEKFNKAPEGKYERLERFEPSNYPRPTKFPSDFKKKGEEEALSVTVAESKSEAAAKDEKKPVEGKKE